MNPIHKKTQLQIPELSLVLMIGPSGSGKSTFAKKHFLETEIVSSDQCRAWVSDDEENQSVSKEAFELLNTIVSKRLKLGRLTVIDATNVQAESRATLIRLAKEHHALCVAFVMDTELSECVRRNQQRNNRNLSYFSIRNQFLQLRKSQKYLKKEGLSHVHWVRADDEIEIERIPLWNNKKEITGPFDIIGDIHGCKDELETLLLKLEYQNKNGIFSHPKRTAIFLGDLVDRGPDSPGVLDIVMPMVEGGHAYCIMGNHESKLLKYLNGKEVKQNHGLEKTVEQLEARELLEPGYKNKIKIFIDSLISHFVFDQGKLVVAHAGLIEEYQGRASGRVREFAMYGETTGEIDEFGLPVRLDWAVNYQGKALVIYGHTPMESSEWINKTLCIDHGCVFGGKLSALKYPERELVSVHAEKEYYAPKKPLEKKATTSKYALDVRDVSGGFIHPRIGPQTIKIDPEQASAALEAMSRFCISPEWLLYLPPTMSPTETHTAENLDGQLNVLEHPNEALMYFQEQGIQHIVCEEKHMGSRAIVILCEDESIGKKHFGHEALGTIYTRTGRAFFSDRNIEKKYLKEMVQVFREQSLFSQLDSPWVMLDCEVLPWSLKAKELIEKQYQALHVAGLHESKELLRALESMTSHPSFGEIEEKKIKLKSQVDQMQRFGNVIEQYIGQDDEVQFAPFHILACENEVLAERDHLWHMEINSQLAQAPLFKRTQFVQLDVMDQNAEQRAFEFWENITNAGGEGIVVKPLNFIAKNENGKVVQPALKVRGKEYLRLIYGPTYTEHFDQLRSRNVKGKRNLALREFALGIEALHRLVDKESLSRIHECIFGVLALECERIDPRL